MTGSVWYFTIAVFATLLHAATLGPLMAADAPTSGPVVDPDVRTQVAAGRSRVVLELRVESRQDPSAIAAVQDQVLAVLPQGHAVLARRYTSVPLLALEIDAEALRTLERLGDAIVRVRADALKRPQ
jgi:hypothetical protein